MQILVTGGAGFIGSTLCTNLLKFGHEITILDNFSTGSKKNLSELQGRAVFIDGDIRDSSLVSDLVSKSDVVYHMAAALGVDNIMKNTNESISVNFEGSEKVINACSLHGKRLLIASTSEVYGKNPKQPLSEEDDRVVGTPQKIRWTYSDAKALEEAVAHSLFLQGKLRVTTVRFFNTVGPRQTGMYGMVLPRFVSSALKGEEIRVFGDGTQTRVFCHVSDAVRAVISLMEDESTIGEVFNVGGVGEISINQLAQKIIDITGSKSKISHIPYSDAYPVGYEDMMRRVPNISKIRKKINWEPQKSLEDIISDVANYLKTQ
jgi:UDP-glucose 4-epimerase